MTKRFFSHKKNPFVSDYVKMVQSKDKEVIIIFRVRRSVVSKVEKNNTGRRSLYNVEPKISKRYRTG